VNEKRKAEKHSQQIKQMKQMKAEAKAII